MSASSLILGVSGLRGIVGESLTPEVAVRYAGSFGAWVREREGIGTIVVARDGRAGGESIMHAAISGLLASGHDVRAIDVAATPSAGIAVDGDAIGAIVVTASHNPSEWNGLKCLVFDPEIVGGRAPNAHEAQEIVAIYENGGDAAQRSDVHGMVEHTGGATITTTHAAMVAHAIGGLLGAETLEDIASSRRVVLDSVNASGASGAETLVRGLGAHCVQLFGDGSGVFPHTPEPTAQNLSGSGGLCDGVVGLGADIGFAQDPDADRLAIIDEHGGYIGEEYTLALCAMSLMEMGADQVDPVFIVNLSTSRMIDDVVAHYAGRVERTAVGEAHVVERMSELMNEGQRVVLGGEGNGGVVWSEVSFVRDSLSAIGLVLALMAKTGKSVSELVSAINAMGPTQEVRDQGYTILKSKSALASKSDAAPVVERLNNEYASAAGCRVDLQDGIRIDWDERGVWAHVRASNTEPIMRVIVEAPSADEARRTGDEIASLIGSV